MALEPIRRVPVREPRSSAQLGLGRHVQQRQSRRESDTHHLLAASLPIGFETHIGFCFPQKLMMVD